MDNADCDVLIVGAGPVGLALGCELLRHGLQVRVIDALAQPVVYSKAAVVHARTMEILETLGVATEIAARSKIIHGMSAFSQGKRVAHVLFDTMESPWPHVYGVSQHDTEEILTRRLQQVGGQIDRSRRLESFTQDEGGVTARIVDLRAEAAGAVQTLRARWIVGCDGAHSVVRHQLNLGFEGGAYEERLIQTDAFVEWPHRLEDDEIVAFLTPDGPVACFPFFHDGRYRVIKVYTGDAPSAEPTLETFAQLLEQVCPGAKIRDPSWIIGFRIHHRLAERYRVGRALIAGDACHIHSPAGGQGMNTGIQDAHNLAWKLALVHQGKARPVLLDSYETERRPIAAELLRGTDLATRAMAQAVKLRSPLSIALRNSLMTLVTRLDIVRENATKAMSMLERHYRNSPIVAEYRQPPWHAKVLPSSDSELPGLSAWTAFAAGPDPGERAPDVVIHADATAGADATVLDALSVPLANRLYGSFSATRYTLLLFDGQAETEAGYRNLAAIAQAVAARCGDAVISHLVLPGGRDAERTGFGGHIIADVEGRIHDRYGARAESLYLIRPDGHIAYRSQPADGKKLLEYLDTQFVQG